MRKKIHTFSIITFTFSLAAAQAAVVQRWTVETSRVQPVVFDAVRGETLSLEASFQSYEKAVAIPTNGWCILWQTNGMGSAWWSAGASCEREVKEEGQGQQWNGSSSSALYPLSSTNYVVKATFTPAMDPGADTVIGFLGATGQNYRASFRLRFRHGPGERPNTLAAPVPILDLAHTTVINPPWPTAEDLKAYIDGEIEGAVGIDAATAGTIATNAITNVVTKAYVEGLGITASAGSVDESAIIAATNALATAVAAKIAAATNDVNAIIASSNLCTVAAAQAMTNAAVSEAVLKGYDHFLALQSSGYYDITAATAARAENSSTADYAAQAGIATQSASAYAASWADKIVPDTWNTFEAAFQSYGVNPRFCQKAQGEQPKFFAFLDEAQAMTNGVRTYADVTFAPKLTGRAYDFANGSNFTMHVYAALTNVIQTLGGSVTNAPSFN